MKVNEPPPVRPTRKIGRGALVPPPRQAGGARSDAPDQEETTPDHDSVAVQGVPAEAFTPSVEEAMTRLIGEVADLREALDQSNKRLDYLTRLADQDSISALLNRRGFVRELSRVLVLAEQSGVASSLIFLEIGNLKKINIRHGLAAGDAAIEHAARIVRDRFVQGTVAGRLGGAELGIVLIGEAADAARRQAQHLAAALAENPLIWEGQAIALAMQWGVHSLAVGEDAQEAMNAADRAMRGSDG
jgi:diguanylate cyclase (GGDEF)-like protein